MSQSTWSVPSNQMTLEVRRPRCGPELDLVLEFIKHKLPQPKKDHELSIFLEPKIETGFPDIVAVYWSISAAKSWHPNRLKLSSKDIRVLHLLSLTDGLTHSSIERFAGPTAKAAIKNLLAADLVVENRDSYQIKGLQDIFAVKRLIAIEAKIADWKNGLSQAFQNTWFASESYLLLEKIPGSSRDLLLKEAKNLGVGLLTPTKKLSNCNIEARSDIIPKSYASWLFNEWAWKAKFMNIGNRIGAFA